MKNKQVAECKRPKQNNSIIRIEPDLFDELNRLSNITRTPVKEIASRALRFALEHVVTKPIECYDVEFK